VADRGYWYGVNVECQRHKDRGTEGMPLLCRILLPLGSACGLIELWTVFSPCVFTHPSYCQWVGTVLGHDTCPSLVRFPKCPIYFRWRRRDVPSGPSIATLRFWPRKVKNAKIPSRFLAIMLPRADWFAATKEHNVSWRSLCCRTTLWRLRGQG